MSNDPSLVYVGFNRMHDQIPESNPQDTRSDEQVKSRETKRRLEILAEQRELKRATEDLW